MEPIMQFFSYIHLPKHLQAVSKPFAELASVLMLLPRNPERTVALRKLLEAKDAAVRASIYKEPSKPSDIVVEPPPPAPGDDPPPPIDPPPELPPG